MVRRAVGLQMKVSAATFGASTGMHHASMVLVITPEFGLRVWIPYMPRNQESVGPSVFESEASLPELQGHRRAWESGSFDILCFGLGLRV